MGSSAWLGPIRRLCARTDRGPEAARGRPADLRRPGGHCPSGRLVNQSRGGRPVGIVEHGVVQRRQDALERGLLAHVRQTTLVMQLQSSRTSRLVACVVNGRVRHTAAGAVRTAPPCVVDRVLFYVLQTLSAYASAVRRTCLLAHYSAEATAGRSPATSCSCRVVRQELASRHWRLLFRLSTTSMRMGSAQFRSGPPGDPPGPLRLKST